jgi:predicted Rossmann fold nucleotide-binding protein DprA/Smf involved in DNA uptake
MTVKQLVAAMTQATQIFKLSMKEVAHITGYHHNTVRNWYKGNISLEQYVKWADKMGFEVVVRRKYTEDEDAV